MSRIATFILFSVLLALVTGCTDTNDAADGDLELTDGDTTDEENDDTDRIEEDNDDGDTTDADVSDLDSPDGDDGEEDAIEQDSIENDIADGDEAEDDLTETETPEVEAETEAEEEAVCDCFIDGQCLMTGDSDPSRGCAICKPDNATNAWSPREAGYLCRPVAGLCDSAEETCDGQNLDCPQDSLEPDTTICRESVELCDTAEYCPGDGAECPEDTWAAFGFSCQDELTCTTRDVCDGEGGLEMNCLGLVYSCTYGQSCQSHDEYCNCESGNLAGVLGKHTGLNEAKNVFVQGQRAYVIGGSTNTGWMAVVDVSDPANTVQLGLKEGLAFPTGIFVRGEKAYLTEYGGILKIIDISDMENLPVLGSYAAPESRKYFFDIKVAGNYAYISNYFEGVNIIDISNPAAPSRIKRIWGLNDDIKRLDVRDNRLYVCEYDEGMRVYDVSDPANATLLSTTFIGDGVSSYCTSVFVRGQVAFVLSETPGAVYAYDITDTENITLLDYTTWQHANIRNFFVEGDLVYVQEYGRIVILDASDPGNISMASDYNLQGVEEARNIFVSNHRAYTPHYNPSDANGLGISDLTMCECCAGYARTDNGCEWAVTPDTAGDLVISEIMAHPGLSAFFQPEWFEITNTTAAMLDLEGCTLETNNLDSHVIGDLAIPSGEAITIGNAGHIYESMVTPVSLVIPELTLDDDGDSLTIRCGEELIDTVTYDSSLVAAGASMKLDESHLDATDNDDAANWCIENTSTYGDLNQTTLYGTPGAENGSCTTAP